MPEISVVVPSYNSANFITETVNSILSQSFSDFEIIIVDASSDDTLEKLSLINDSRIKILSVENVGAVFSYVEGIKAARGKYITFCDSDDFYAQDFLLTALDDIKKYGCDFASYKYEIYNEATGGTEVKENYLEQGLYKDAPLNADLYNHIVFNSFAREKMYLIPMVRWNKVYSRDFLMSFITELDARCIQLEDNVFSVLAFIKSKSFYVSNSLSAYRYIKRKVSVSNGCAYDDLLGKYLYSINALKTVLEKNNYKGDYNQLHFLAYDSARIAYRRIAKSCPYSHAEKVLRQIKNSDFYSFVKMKDLKGLKNICFHFLSKANIDLLLYLIFRHF